MKKKRKFTGNLGNIYILVLLSSVPALTGVWLFFLSHGQMGSGTNLGVHCTTAVIKVKIKVNEPST